MKPGRELDALVAEKVMGWEHVTEDQFIDHVCVTCPTHKHEGAELLAYSTDIAAAWEVVNVLDEKSGPLLLFSDRYGGCYSQGLWIAYFGINPEAVVSGAWGGDPEAMEYWDSPTPGAVAGHTPAHAICLAALKAVGVELKEAVECR